jgi:pilus assembly protein CpaE
MPDTNTIDFGLDNSANASMRELHPQAPAHAVALRAPAAGRPKFIGFTKDHDSAALLQEVFAGHLNGASQMHVTDFKGARGILAGMATPEIVLVDLSDEDQPINAMMDLAEVVEMGTVVLAIGKIQNVSFYRTLTKGMGVREYLPKPLTRESVERNFLPVLGVSAAAANSVRGGRMVALIGARGGAGTSTLAGNLAWYASSELHRHTALVDSDLYTGTAALDLDVESSRGFGTALESPDRLDPLLLERAMHAAAERLHVLAAQEPLTRQLDYQLGSAAMLSKALRARYNFVVADAGARLSPFARDLLTNAQARVIVIDPTMISIRNLERISGLKGAAGVRNIIALNRAGAPGGLSQTYMEQVMALKFDAVIPDLPRIVPRCARLGTQAAALRGPFRNGIAQLAQALGMTLMEEER